MQLSDVRDWLKEIFPEAEHFYIGRIDSSQEKCIGIYDGNPIPDSPCISFRTFREIPVSILIHWTENAKVSQASALELYSRLQSADFPEIGGHKIPLISLLNSSPVDCTPPESLIYEYVIHINIFYNI